MTGLIVKFVRLDGGKRRLLLQAWRELLRARRELSHKPFRELIARLETSPGEVLCPAGDPGRAGQARTIGWAVRVASAYAPWDSSCLVQVMAAQKMMQSREIGGAIYLGAPLMMDEDFIAHAWLKHGEIFITGEAGHERFKTLTTFTW